MYLSKLRIWNFRRFSMVGESFDSALPGVEEYFKDGLNVLVGENDTGKTAIVDAIRYALRTQSYFLCAAISKEHYQESKEIRERWYVINI